MAFVAVLGLSASAALAGTAAVGLAAGTVANGIAAGKAGKAANKMETLAGQVPKSSGSQYPGMMIDQAKSELNSQNPFLAAQQRGIAGSQANAFAAAKSASLDPSTLLAMTQKYNDSANNAINQFAMQNYGMRENKLQDLYKGYGMGQQQDQMNYDNAMTAFNSSANLQNAAGQTRVNAWQNVGNGLLSAGAAAAKMSSGMPAAVDPLAGMPQLPIFKR